MPMDLSKYLLPLDRPVAFQLSGGRTSGMGLRLCQLAHGGRLPDNVLVLFENTGAEMKETYDFLWEMDRRWKINLRMLEFTTEKPLFQEVGHNSYSSNYEPMRAIIRQRKYLPNVVTRFCTEVLKVRTARRFLISQGFKRWNVVIGFRADEPGRVLKMKLKPRPREVPLFPLYDDGITRRMVSQWWKEQDFNLALPDNDGKTPLGNCDGCFLKSEKNLAYLARYHPERFQVWVDMEADISALAGEKKTFVNGRSYADIQKSVKGQPDMFFEDGFEAGPYCSTSLGGCHGD